MKSADDYDLEPSLEFMRYQQCIINKKLRKVLENTIINSKSMIQERVGKIKYNRQQVLLNLMESQKKELDTIFKPFYHIVPQLERIKSMYDEHFPVLKSLFDSLCLIDNSILSHYEHWERCSDLLSQCHSLINNENADNLIYSAEHVESLSRIIKELNIVVSECERMRDSLANRQLLNRKS